MRKTELRVALVHDYLRTFGGGERVLLALIDLFPKADVFVASANFENVQISHYFKKHKWQLKTTWVQSVRLFRIKPILYRAFLPFVWKSFDFTGYDLVISSSGSNMALCIDVPDKIPHICYCHTPPKFLMDSSSTESGLHNNLVLKYLIKPYLLFMKVIVKQSASKVTIFVANSHYIRSKIEQYLKMDALVIYPPLMLECANISSKKHTQKSYLVVSRLETNKNLALIIRAFNKSKRELVIVGTGRQEKYLRKIANTNIKFLGFVSDTLLKDLYAKSIALVVAAEDEDFGLSVIESISQGTPVIAPHEGGFRESIKNGTTGFFYYRNTVDALNRAVDQLERSKISVANCVKFAGNYHRSVFNRKILRLTEKVMKNI